MNSKLAKLALTATIALALTLITSCGNHSFEELLGLESSSSQPSSSSLRQSSSSQQQSSSSSSPVANVSSDSQQQSSDSHPGVVVGPLLKTKWGQGSPYNDLFPLVNGERIVTNCETTAKTQIMKFHKYPARGNGESSVINTTGGNFNVPLASMDVAYDWDNMLNEYTTANPGTEQQRSAIATFTYHYALARGAIGRRMAIIHFGYDKSYQRIERKYYSDAEWEAIIRKQLDLGLPVYYFGYPFPSNNENEEDSGDNISHAWVVDGYDNAGKFHINPGWYGRDNGWYSLNNIAIGSGNGYNYNHVMEINIKPDAGSIGINEMALDSFTVSKTTVSRNDGITVVFKIKRTGIFPGGQSGVALVNNSGNIVEVIGTRNYDASAPTSLTGTWTSTIKFSVPYSVNAGQYNLRIVTKMNGETDWKIVARSLPNVPKSIPFTVTAETETGVKGGGYGLWLGKLESEKTTVSINEGFKVSSILKNVSSETFPATAGVALMDYDNNIVAILSTWEISINANSGTSRTATYKVPSTVTSGQYKLRIVVKTPGKDEWRVVTATEENIPTFIDFIVQ